MLSTESGTLAGVYCTHGLSLDTSLNKFHVPGDTNATRDVDGFARDDSLSLSKGLDIVYVV